MNNGKKYEELKEHVERAKSPSEKIERLAAMVFMIATNDLDCIYRVIKRLLIAIIILTILVVASNVERAMAIIVPLLKAL